MDTTVEVFYEGICDVDNVFHRQIALNSALWHLPQICTVLA